MVNSNFWSARIYVQKLGLGFQIWFWVQKLGLGVPQIFVNIFAFTESTFTTNPSKPRQCHHSIPRMFEIIFWQTQKIQSWDETFGSWFPRKNSETLLTRTQIVLFMKYHSLKISNLSITHNLPEINFEESREVQNQHFLKL